MLYNIYLWIKCTSFHDTCAVLSQNHLIDWARNFLSYTTDTDTQKVRRVVMSKCIHAPLLSDVNEWTILNEWTIFIFFVLSWLFPTIDKTFLRVYTKVREASYATWELELYVWSYFYNPNLSHTEASLTFV